MNDDERAAMSPSGTHALSVWSGHGRRAAQVPEQCYLGRGKTRRRDLLSTEYLLYARISVRLGRPPGWWLVGLWVAGKQAAGLGGGYSMAMWTVEECQAGCRLGISMYTASC